MASYEKYPIFYLFRCSFLFLLPVTSSYPMWTGSYALFGNSLCNDFIFLNDATIIMGTIQLTRNTFNADHTPAYQSGRQRSSLHSKTIASFNLTFVFNTYRITDQPASEGLTFWLGLSDSFVDGCSCNQFVTVEFDTVKQSFDPDDNHVGIDVNSVKSLTNASLTSIGLNLTTGVNHIAWVEYDSSSQLMRVFVEREVVGVKPESPLLSYRIDISEYLSKPDIIFRVLSFNGRDRGAELHVIMGGVTIGSLCGGHRRRRSMNEGVNLKATLKRLPGMPREFGFKELPMLGWGHRYKMLGNVALALHYLHTEYDQRVVHRDLKASTIMLDSEFNARLGDFGLARVLDHEKTSYVVENAVPSTLGYIAPECFSTGKATRESDVFGFGAAILEVAQYREGRVLEVVDPGLQGEYEQDDARRLLQLGLACSHTKPVERPRTETIVHIVAQSVPPLFVPPFRPPFVWDVGFSTTTSTNGSISLPHLVA
ncbi:hypothetical protein AMTRI_Chr06g200510 [Amborella trichopoda]